MFLKYKLLIVIAAITMIIGFANSSSFKADTVQPVITLQGASTEGNRATASRTVTVTHRVEHHDTSKMINDDLETLQHQNNKADDRKDWYTATLAHTADALIWIAKHGDTLKYHN